MSDTYDIKSNLLSAFRSLMTPLVRILLRNGIAFREFAEVLKEVYVTVCARDMVLPGRRMSLSRIAIMTGLTRKEVASIVNGDGQRKIASDTNANRAARVLEAWHSSPEYLAPYGFPRDLSIDSDGVSGSFEELVRRFSGDMPARAMLDELLRVEAVKLLDDGQHVRVLKRTYIPTNFTPEMIEIFSRAVRRYIETVDHNLSLQDPSKRRFDRMVYPDKGMRDVDVSVFQQEVREYLERVIAEIDAKSATYPVPESERGEAPVQVGVGLYFYREEVDDKRSLVELLGRVDENEDDDREN